MMTTPIPKQTKSALELSHNYFFRESEMTVMRSTITRKDLEEMGYRPYTAATVIRQAKQIMVKRGYPFYRNKRLSHVPIDVVESILGISLSMEPDNNA
jgi:hypothetical protein